MAAHLMTALMTTEYRLAPFRTRVCIMWHCMISVGMNKGNRPVLTGVQRAKKRLYLPVPVRRGGWPHLGGGAERGGGAHPSVFRDRAPVRLRCDRSGRFDQPLAAGCRCTPGGTT